MGRYEIYKSKLGPKIEWTELITPIQCYPGSIIVVKDLSYDENIDPPTLGTQVYNVSKKIYKCGCCNKEKVVVILENEDITIEFDDTGETIDANGRPSHVEKMYEFYFGAGGMLSNLTT